MVRFKYTNEINLLCRLINMALNIVILFFIAGLIQPIFELQMAKGDAEVVSIICGFVLMCAIKIMFFDNLFDVISAYVYIRLKLSVRVSFSEARELCFLFVPNKTGNWYPMKEVQKLPDNMKREYLFYIASEVSDRLKTNDLNPPQPSRKVEDGVQNVREILEATNLTSSVAAPQVAPIESRGDSGKTCPQCQSINSVAAPQCVCGYRFKLA